MKNAVLYGWFTSTGSTKRWKWKEDGGNVKEIESNLITTTEKVNAFVDEDEKPAFMDDVSPQQT